MYDESILRASQLWRFESATSVAGEAAMDVCDWMLASQLLTDLTIFRSRTQRPAWRRWELHQMEVPVHHLEHSEAVMIYQGFRCFALAIAVGSAVM